MEPEDQSTEGDGSSHTQDSSSVSDSGVSDVDEDSEQCGTLQDLIKNDVMRLDQGVAEHLCRSLDGRLVCAPPTRTDQFEDTSQLSLLQRLELQESSIVDQEVAWTTYAPSSSGQSSSSSTSTPNKGGAISSSSKGGQGRGSDGPPTGHGKFKILSQLINYHSDLFQSLHPQLRTEANQQSPKRTPGQIQLRIPKSSYSVAVSMLCFLNYSV